MGEACVRVNAPQVIHESIDGEVILIDLGTGSYYSLKGAGAEIWDALDRAGAATAPELADALVARYDVGRTELEAAIDGLLTELSDEGLVVGASDRDKVQSPSRVDGAEANVTFEAPRLEKFTDMQDLVLLDPVHEVDATGWPQRRPDDAAVA
jgi:hypothetical protein